MFEGDEAEDLVTVRVSHDANEAALLKGLLEDHGIVVATPGLEHRGMLGIAGGFVKIPIKVPRRDKAEAEALLEALEGSEVDDDEDEAAPEEAPRRRRIAIFVACVLTFGCGHFYVRQNVAGLVLAIIELSAVLVICSGQPIAVALLVGCVLADITGSFAAVRRQERGLDPPTDTAQVLRTVVTVAVTTALSFGAIQLIPEDEERMDELSSPAPAAPFPLF